MAAPNDKVLTDDHKTQIFLWDGTSLGGGGG